MMKPWTDAIHHLLHAGTDFLLPRRCWSCGATVGEASLFCPGCAVSAHPASGRICPRCGQPGVTVPSRCSRCREFAFRRAAAGALYHGVIRELVLGLKFGGRRALAHPLSRLALFGAQRALGGGRADCVVAVPLHPARRRRRGYNQAELLAEEVALALDRPHLRGVIRRTRNTRPQGAGGGGSREENVRGAFGTVKKGIGPLLRGEVPADAVRGAHVLLVDDVLSTGATVDQCARVLMAAGSSAVTVAAVAT